MTRQETTRASGEALREQMRGAARVVYACRPYHPSHRASRMRCADCGRAISVTPTVLAKRRVEARLAGVRLDVLCDDCALASGEAAGGLLLHLNEETDGLA